MQNSDYKSSTSNHLMTTVQDVLAGDNIQGPSKIKGFFLLLCMKGGILKKCTINAVAY